jgi:hypothetical protein
MTTALEQDFTVEGKKGKLQCPFSQPAAAASQTEGENEGSNMVDSAQSGDPICAALSGESSKSTAPTANAAGRCPIRYMDRHRPEEIAQYVEVHKHELPRSHEVCLRRYQRSEDQIRKLDSKYGNVVSMIEGLGQLHKRMLPETNEEDHEIGEGSGGHERVENWVDGVYTIAGSENHPEAPVHEHDEHRDGHFDRPLKEVRLGESPSRPWGIPVQVQDLPSFDDLPMSPPPAPVRMPIPTPPMETQQEGDVSKCPFHQMGKPAEDSPSPSPAAIRTAPSHSARAAAASYNHQLPSMDVEPPTGHPPRSQPAFINAPSTTKSGNQVPQMVFTGPVFIGYPMEQAIQFMNQYNAGH